MGRKPTGRRPGRPSKADIALRDPVEDGASLPLPALNAIPLPPEPDTSPMPRPPAPPPVQSPVKDDESYLSGLSSTQRESPEYLHGTALRRLGNAYGLAFSDMADYTDEKLRFQIKLAREFQFYQSVVG